MASREMSISGLHAELRDAVSLLETTGEHIFVMDHSRPAAVLVRFQDYNSLRKQAEGEHPRIVRRSDVSGGEPLIRGTRITVRHIIERFQAGESPEDIKAALPHLTLAQIYDALSYYYDHRDEIEDLLRETALAQVLEAQRLTIDRVAHGIQIARIMNE